jgi:hypothetical protein
MIGARVDAKVVKTGVISMDEEGLISLDLVITAACIALGIGGPKAILNQGQRDRLMGELGKEIQIGSGTVHERFVRGVDEVRGMMDDLIPLYEEGDGLPEEVNDLASNFVNASLVRKERK